MVNIIKIKDISSVSDSIVQMHKKYFCQQLGWGPEFEGAVKKYIDSLYNEFQADKEGLWVSQEEHKVVGSLAIDGREADPENARLRIFVVDQAYQHQGVGTALLKTALQHCNEVGYKKVVLWTFDVLDGARHLYLKNGFKCTQERSGTYWGKNLTEQLFTLELS
jgi:GNAT superfamily N-acetyltransferase